MSTVATPPEARPTSATATSNLVRDTYTVFARAMRMSLRNPAWRRTTANVHLARCAAAPKVRCSSKLGCSISTSRNSARLSNPPPAAVGM